METDLQKSPLLVMVFMSVVRRGATSRGFMRAVMIVVPSAICEARWEVMLLLAVPG